MNDLRPDRFPRARRLRRHLDFQRVQRTGRKIQGAHLAVVYAGSPEVEPRFGLAVSRKVGTAVVRNRVKRWIREAVRRQQSGLASVDVVFIARTSAPGAGYAVLHAEVGAALARVKKECS